MDILSADLWGMDDTDYRVLDNRMVVTRSVHECAICFENIPSSTRVRAQREAYDGKAMTFYICQICCAAVIADPDGDAFAERYEVGRQNCEKRRA
jgi:hypothetical protein